ncbi:prosaposin [Rhynchophorus ferrugineus]|uniref:prosaposin n=1 Tax=Rhynchophorus ferrugineus TaxID=354439 RepID=UPI003FCC8AA2
MKTLIFIALVCVLANGVFVPPRHYKKQVHLLGEKQCTYGPSYWCQNLTNAADCHATKHCIQTVWIHQNLPPDTTSICDTCKEMVKEARDQLESNDTMELIKQVFEGSCALLRLKPIVIECDKIADNYIPDLIETLASEMNPAAVCSVAGLCNNPRVHQLLTEAGEDLQGLTVSENTRNRCENCNTVMDIVVKKFNDLTQIEFMNDLLEFCGKFSSYSDACTNIVIKHFPDIYSFLKAKLNSNDVCLLSGECYTNFHKHEVEITPMSKIGYVHPEGKDDLPCDLCKQLVTHLREVLIANTTEMEFKQVLEGLCKQTRSFKDECLSFVKEYYDTLYNYLVKELNATAACDVIGICPNGKQLQHPIAPLLLEDTAQIAKRLHIESSVVPHEIKTLKDIRPNNMLYVGSPEQMQLPIDLLTPRHSVYNEQLCMFCQYFLHYCQVAISTPSVEADIKKVIDEACEKLPRSVNATCIEFIDTYEPALIAILAQEIDPSQVCPMIRVCPSNKAKDVDIFMNAKSSDNCPFCLAIVTEIEDIVKGKTSKDEIKQALEKVCLSLPESLKVKCNDFIETYTDELVEMIIADFKPSEVCEYLKFCKDSTPPVKSNDEGEITNTNYGGDIETNSIYDNTIDGKPIEHVGDMSCVLCEYVMKEIDDQLKDKKTDDEIKNVVLGICKVMPKSVATECNNFIDQYGDAIIVLLQEALEPSQICAMIKFCPKSDQLQIVKEEVTKCGVCISTVDIIRTIMENPNVDRNIGHVFEKTCRGIPFSKKQSEPKRKLQHTVCYNLEKQLDGKCSKMNDFHFDQFKLLLTRFVRENVCSHLNNQEFIDSKKLKNYVNDENPLECFICKTIVKEVANEIKGDKTKEKVRNALQKVCKRTHIKKCTSFVNKYSDKLVDLIFQYASSEEVCLKLMVCDFEVSYYNIKLLQTLKYKTDNDLVANTPDPVECTLCKSVVKRVIFRVKNNKTKENIHHALHTVCKHRTNYKTCNDFVRKYSNKLLDLIMQYTDPQDICTKLAVCNFEILNYNEKYVESSSYQNQMSIHNNDSPDCALCKTVVKRVITEIKTNKTKETIERALHTVCKHVRNHKTCNGFVRKYSNKLVDLIMQYTDPQDICTKLAVCNLEILNYSEKYVEGSSYQNQMSIHSNESSLVYGKVDDLQNPMECFICKLVVKELAKTLKGDKNKQKIKEALLKICKHLRKLRKCSHFVNKYSDKLVDLIVRYGASSIICSKLMLCDYGEYNSDIDIESTEDYLIEDNDPPDCALCKTVVRRVITEIKTNKTKENIEHALHTVCKHVRNHKTCNGFVRKYSNKLVDLIMQYTDPQDICTRLAVCNYEILNYNEKYAESSSRQNQMSFYNNESPFVYGDDDDGDLQDPLECFICNLVTKALAKILEGNRNKEIIKEALLEVCKHLHTFGKCSEFVNKYSDKLVDLIANFGASPIICSKLMLCDYDEYNSDVAVESTEDNESTIGDDISCILCKNIVNTGQSKTETSNYRNEMDIDLYNRCQDALQKCIVFI